MKSISIRMTGRIIVLLSGNDECNYRFSVIYLI